MKISAGISVTAALFLYSTLIDDDVVCARRENYRKVEKAERLPGQISRAKCKEYSDVKIEVAVPTFIVFDINVTEPLCKNDGQTLIVGGEKALPREFPHMALLGFGDSERRTWRCGGSLVSERFVLTAAHCILYPGHGKVSAVRLGDLNIDEMFDDAAPEEFLVIEHIQHPKYQPPSQYNDIGLLKLDRDVIYSRYIRPACLHGDINVPAQLIATGWGVTNPHGDRSSDLLKVILKPVAQDACNVSYALRISERRLRHGIVPDSQLCAGSLSDKPGDTCQGDSGGPLQMYHDEYNCMHAIVAVTSTGVFCGVLPGIYSRVHAYIKWLEDTIWPAGS